MQQPKLILIRRNLIIVLETFPSWSHCAEFYIWRNPSIKFLGIVRARKRHSLNNTSTQYVLGVVLLLVVLLIAYNSRPGSRGGLLHTWLYQVTHWDDRAENKCGSISAYAQSPRLPSMNIQPPSLSLSSCNLVPSHHRGLPHSVLDYSKQCKHFMSENCFLKSHQK